jgi:hypothetical protein
MAPCRETGTSDLADHLSSADPLTRLNQITRGVVEGALHPNSINAAVAEEQPIAIGGVKEGPGNHARVRRTNRCAASGGEVSAVVQFPDSEQWMEPHPKAGTHSTRHRVEKPMTARLSSRGPDRTRPTRRRGLQRASLSRALHDLTLRLGHQAQPTTATAEKEQRVEIALALPQSPVQAAATMPARSEDPDHLSQRHAFTDAQRGDHWLVRGADRAVVDADDGLAGDRPSEHDRAARRCQDGLTRFGDKINTAVPGAPDERWGSEPPLHNGRPAKWPATWRGQQWGSHGRSRNGEHGQANGHKDRHLKVSTEDSHGGSLWTLAGILQLLANLWTTVEVTAYLWTAAAREWISTGGGQARCVSADRRIDSPVQICQQV